MGYKTYQDRQDLVRVVQENVAALKGFQPKKNVQKDFSSRLSCDLFDESFSQVSVNLRMFKESQKFDRRSRSSWKYNQLDSGFTLGNDMAINNGHANIVGEHCEVAFSNILRANRTELDLKDQNQFCEANAPRVFALLQFQAIRELGLDGNYSRFDTKGLNLDIIFSEDQSKFIVRRGEPFLRACLGSKDVFVGDKKTTMKYPILMDEHGNIVVTLEFLEIVASLG